MTRSVRVLRVFDDGTAEVSAPRQSACGESCADCGGCSPVKRQIVIKANTSGHELSPGDMVLIENPGVILASCIAFLPEIILFFCGYAAFGQIGGLFGFLTGCAAAVLLARVFKAESKVIGVTDGASGNG